MVSQAQYQNFLRQAGWPDIQVNSRSGTVPLLALMGAIGKAESDGDPTAVNANGEYSVGLWQINIAPHLGRPYRASALKDPVYNAQVALQIYQQQGLRAWGAYTDGRYRPFLSEALRVYGQGFTGTPAPTLGYENWEELLADANPNYAEFLNSGVNGLFPAEAGMVNASYSAGSISTLAIVFGGLVLFSALINR